MYRPLLATAVAATISATAGQAAVTVTVEAAGVQATTRTAPSFVETFATRTGTIATGTGAPGIATFTTDFGGANLSGTFTGFELGSPSAYSGSGAAYGGAFGSDNYGVVHGSAEITLSRATKYFGLWAAALDGNNTVELLRDGVSLGAFQLTSSIGSLGSAYYGNPNNGADGGEAFAFVNFASTTPFNQVRFLQSGGGFEFDDVTVGGAVPEPATWGLMILGFGLTGAAMRRRRQAAQPALA